MNNKPTSPAVVAALSLLGLELPFSEDALKSAFRSAALNYHPDHYKGKDANEKMVGLLSARTIAEWFTDESNGGANQESIFPLPWIEKLENDERLIPCNTCEGKGYEEVDQWDEKKCPSCKGHSRSQAYDFKEAFAASWCWLCFGTGWIQIGVPYTIKRACYRCGGTGKKKKVLFNQVIKGKLNLTF